MNTKTQSTSSAITAKLSVMMFLQFFIWGAWFATLAQCLGSNGLGDSAGGAYGSAPYGAIFAPLFLGLIADRFFPSQIVMGVLFLLGGVLMYFARGNAAVAGVNRRDDWCGSSSATCSASTPTLGSGELHRDASCARTLDRVSFLVGSCLRERSAGLSAGLSLIGSSGLGYQGADLFIPCEVAASVSVILGACLASSFHPRLLRAKVRKGRDLRQVLLMVLTPSGHAS